MTSFQRNIEHFIHKIYVVLTLSNGIVLYVRATNILKQNFVKPSHDHGCQVSRKAFTALSLITIIINITILILIIVIIITTYFHGYYQHYCYYCFQRK